MAGGVQTAGKRLVAAGDLALAIPDNPRGIGSVIVSPASTALIAGVRVEPLAAQGLK